MCIDDMCQCQVMESPESVTGVSIDYGFVVSVFHIFVLLRVTVILLKIRERKSLGRRRYVFVYVCCAYVLCDVSW